jgi:hypothetical protein
MSYCRNCGSARETADPYCPNCGAPFDAPAVSAAATRTRTWIVVVATLAVIAVGAAAVGFILVSYLGRLPAKTIPGSTTPTSSADATRGVDPSATPPAAEEVVVPSFAKLGGLNALSADDSVYAGGVYYGDTKYLDKYRKIASDSGLKVEFFTRSAKDSVFQHGMGGWPADQLPKPGTRVPRGSTVRMTVIQE